MDTLDLLAYVGRLIEDVTLRYGATRDSGHATLGQEDPGSPSALLRGLNDILWIPLKD